MTRELVLGVDFGSSSTIAGVLIGDDIQLVHEQGERVIPSVVYVPDRGPPEIGRKARLRNVVAVLPGRSPLRIYVSGHYDTVARIPGKHAAPAPSSCSTRPRERPMQPTLRTQAAMRRRMTRTPQAMWTIQGMKSCSGGAFGSV